MEITCDTASDSTGWEKIGSDDNHGWKYYFAE